MATSLQVLRGSLDTFWLGSDALFDKLSGKSLAWLSVILGVPCWWRWWRKQPSSAMHSVWGCRSLLSLLLGLKVDMEMMFSFLFLMREIDIPRL